MVGCGSKNGQSNNICSKEIGLCAQISLIIIDTIVNITKGFRYNHLIAPRIFNFDNE